MANPPDVHDLYRAAANASDIRNHPSADQGTMRKLVSISYYAVFHLIMHETLGAVFDRPTHASMFLQRHGYRCFQHGKMRSVCNNLKSAPAIMGENIQSSLLSGPRGDRVRDIARTFVKMLAKRHVADYDVFATIMHSEAVDAVDYMNDVFRWFVELKNDTEAFGEFASAMMVAAIRDPQG